MEQDQVSKPPHKQDVGRNMAKLGRKRDKPNHKIMTTGTKKRTTNMDPKKTARGNLKHSALSDTRK
jgi:hypothetical protein